MGQTNISATACNGKLRIQIAFLLLALALGKAAFGQNIGTFYPLTEKKHIVGLHFIEKKCYIVTQASILANKGGSFNKLYNSSTRINSSIAWGNTLYIGTQSGILSVNEETQTTKVISIGSAVDVGDIAIANDGLLLCTPMGVMRKGKGQPASPALDTVPISNYEKIGGGQIVCGKAGCFRYLPDGKLQKCIPDWLANRLSRDTIQNIKTIQERLWIFAKESTIVLSPLGDEFGVEAYFANQGNPLYDVLYDPILGYVFSAQNGLYFNNVQVPVGGTEQAPIPLANILGRDVTREFKVKTGLSQADIIIYDEKSKLYWFANSNGILGISLKDFQKIIN